jgi:hypothetical protein
VHAPLLPTPCPNAPPLKAYEDPLMEVHISFFTAALPLFTMFNLFLQRSDPLAHKIYPVIHELEKKIAQRILKTDTLNNLNEETLDDESNYVELKEIHIGLTTKSTLNRLCNEGEITNSQYQKTLRACQAFYRESLRYVLTKMHNNLFWKHCQWIDYFNRRNASWDSVQYFVTQFSNMLCFSENEGDRLYDEFIDYKSVVDEEFNLNEALLCSYNDGTNEYCMDVIWYIDSWKYIHGNNYRFRLHHSSL